MQMRRNYSPACAALLSALALLLAWAMSAALAETRLMDARQASDLAARGEIILVDIRTPREWRETGIGASALPISMHRSGFLDKIRRAAGGRKDRAIALICAVGGRSARIAQLLRAQGYSHVIDVSEGMLGSSAGPGWIKKGLPLKAYTGG